jgi:DNA-binding NtrC family response regulator
MIETVLILDDQIEIRSSLRQILKRMAHLNVLEAGEISQAKKICNTVLVDLIICDFSLPDGNGHDLFMHLVRTKQKPIFILFTGRDQSCEKTFPCDFNYTVVYQKNIPQLKALLRSFVEEMQSPLRRASS